MKKENAWRKEHSVELLPTFATIVMTLATVAMAYTSCQQTRIANSMEKLTRFQEQTKLLSARKQLAKDTWKVISLMNSDGYGIISFSNIWDYPKVAQKIYELMDTASDNYFLLSHPKEAKTWGEIETALWVRATSTPSNIAFLAVRGDTAAQIFGADNKDVSQKFHKILQLYIDLNLSDLTADPLDTATINKLMGK